MFEALRTRHYTRGIASTLAMLMFVQLLLPIQTHARFERGASGFTVVVCTLQGTRDVEIGLDDPDGVVPGHDSAAMVFSDLLNHFTPIAPPIRPPVAVLQRIGIWQDGQPTPAHLPPPRASSRGPPLA